MQAAGRSQTWTAWLAPVGEVARAHPFVMATAAVILVCWALIVTIDPWITLTLHEAQPPALIAFFRSITDWGKAGPYVYAGIVVFIGARILFLTALPHAVSTLYYRVGQMAAYYLATMAVSGAVVHLLKFTVARLRPKHLLNDSTYGFAFAHPEFTVSSFPSGHSQAVFSAMMALTVLFPRGWVVFLPYAVAVALTRLFVGAHFLSDIIAGAFIGIVAALLVQKRWFADVTEPLPLSAFSGPGPSGPGPIAKDGAAIGGGAA